MRIIANVIGVALAVAGTASAAPPTISGCPVLPATNVWNTPIDTLPVHTLSGTWVTTIGSTSGVHPDFGTFYLGEPIGIPFITVPGTQAPVDIAYDEEAASESDPGPFPIPADAPIEGGSASDGDRHVLVIDRDHCILYELDYAFPRPGGWDAYSGAKFDLRSNALRPDTWTSADAAGLPIFPGLVRYDEVVAGEINHALRFTAQNTRNVHIWPARHDAAPTHTGTQYPPMGARFRLKSTFNISGYSAANQVILRALKKYGMILADNGSNWFISGEHNPSWDDDMLSALSGVKGSDFEAVDESSLMKDPNSGQAGVGKAGDFNASGTSDILIRDNTNGLVYGWLMNGVTIANGGYVLSAGSGWTPVRTLDLNGDGKADILIQHTNGSLYAWIMDGLTVTTGGYLLGAGSGWSVSHTGDFNGDGKQDILLKHTDGSIYIWLMDGFNIVSGTYLQGAGTGWNATHVADFNGDGKSDVLLKHTDGSIYIWQMNGIAIQTGTFLKGAGIDWSPTETGDFNGDGKADILITHTNGGVYLWQMNGTVIQTGTYLMSPGSGWSIAKTGDLDGDGKTDIIIKHTDGSHYAWIMNGLSVTGGGYLLGAGTGWSVSHLLNLDSNNTMDILIKHTDGSIYAWLMSGATISNGAYLMGAGAWRVVPQ